MADIVANTSFIKAALTRGLRIGLFFVNGDTNVEYHFKKDPRDDEDDLNSIVCVMCTSTTSDPLRLCGVTQPIKEFIKMLEKQVIYTNYTTQYQRTGIKVFPGDWYPCFEKNPKKRIADVTKLLPTLEALSAKITEDDRKIIEAEYKRKEEERRRQEEEFKKVTEEYRNRAAIMPLPLISFGGRRPIPHPLPQKY